MAECKALKNSEGNWQVADKEVAAATKATAGVTAGTATSNQLAAIVAVKRTGKFLLVCKILRNGAKSLMLVVNHNPDNLDLIHSHDDSFEYSFDNPTL